MKYIYSLIAIFFSITLLFYALNATYPEFSASLIPFLLPLKPFLPKFFPLSKLHFTQLIFLAILYTYLLSSLIILWQAIKGKLRKFMSTYYGGTLTFCTVFTSIFLLKLLSAHFFYTDTPSKLHELLPNLF